LHAPTFLAAAINSEATVLKTGGQFLTVASFDNIAASFSRASGNPKKKIIREF